MDFALTEEQQDVQQLAAKILAQEVTVDRLKTVEAGRERFDEALWQQLAWWQRSGNIVALCTAGFIAYAVCMFATGFRLADLRGPAKATSVDHSN